MFLGISLGIILLLLAGLLILKPKLVWFITESWKSEYAAEPSEFYIITTRLGGVVVLMVVIYVFYLLYSLIVS